MRAPLARSLALVAALLAGSAAGHATLVFGTASLEPDPPPAGAPFAIDLSLVTAAQEPVEDAEVVAELRSASGELVATADFEEGEAAGAYRATSEPLPAGGYSLVLRDVTFPREEAVAELALAVGAEQPLGPREFIFPPTDTGGQGLGSWLAWLIGLPALAGLLVTVLILTGNRRQDDGPGASRG